MVDYRFDTLPPMQPATSHEHKEHGRCAFEIEGRVVLVMDWHIRGPMGKARVKVDDRPGEVRDAWFDQTWGGYRETNELARDLSPGTHRVVFEILAERNPQSTGHEYRILGLGVAGR